MASFNRFSATGIAIFMLDLIVLPSCAQPYAVEVPWGPSASERLQFEELSRSTQAGIKALHVDSQVTKVNPTGVDSGAVMIQPVDTRLGSASQNVIWSDNQGMWKIDKFGKLCAVSTTPTSLGSANSDPCL